MFSPYYDEEPPILILRSVQLVIYVWFQVEIKAAAMKWFEVGGPGGGGGGGGG